MAATVRLNAIISIHALLAEGDRLWPQPGQACSWISIHALLAEGDSSACASLTDLPDFYPRPPCGGRRYRSTRNHLKFKISIHALLAEGDREDFRNTVNAAFISIHALLAEGDPDSWYLPMYGRISIHALLAEGDQCICGESAGSRISIHALLAEGDWRIRRFAASHADFYPRPPCGGRRLQIAGQVFDFTNFYPRPPCGGRPIAAGPSYFLPNFYPRPPCGGRLRHC